MFLSLPHLTEMLKMNLNEWVEATYFCAMLLQNSPILITGAAGFIGSCIASFLNQHGFHNLYLVDDFNREDKQLNFSHLKYAKLIDRNTFEMELETIEKPQWIIHFGARTDTTEMDYEIHEKWNVVYSKMIWKFATTFQIPLVYASSAATYGNGELGYDDRHDILHQLQPLNPYGVSKNEFDKWVLEQQAKPPHWYGLKFFNVFGPNEYHKGRMASVIFHAFHQIKQNHTMRLFRSHHPNYADGEQQRDFIYVKDLLQMVYWLMEHTPSDGLYNIGTGKAETFLSLAHAVFSALDLPSSIEFVDTPLDIRDKYQYFTEATMHKLRSAGYDKPCFTLHDAVRDYVQNYLKSQHYF